MNEQNCPGRRFYVFGRRLLSERCHFSDKCLPDIERGVAVDGAVEGEAQAIWLSILERMLEQAIRQRAYELYIKRGMPLGHALDDGGSRACTRPLNVRFQRK
jgi:hypothetical protein